MADSKPRSFRIDDETADKFKEISNSIGGNQQETLAKLIEAFEFQSGKAILMEKKTDIEQFERYVTALTRMFMNSLEDNQNITDTVRTEFEALLHSKDNTIQDLQAQLTVAKQLKEEAATKAKSYVDENSRLNEYIESLQEEYSSKLNDMQSMLVDKENLNRALTDSCNNLKAKVDVMEAEHEEVAILRKNIATITFERDSLKKSTDEAEKLLSRANKEHEKVIAAMQQHEVDLIERTKAEAQIAQDKVVLELESKYREQIQNFKEQKQAEIDKYQQKYLELLEQIKSV